MRTVEFIVTAEDAGDRLDRFLARHMPEELSRTAIQRLIGAGSVFVNKAVHHSHRKLKERDVVEVRIPDPEISRLHPERIPLDIVYEDECVVVVNKPAGMVTHPGAGNESGTLANALVYHCGGLSSVGGAFRPGMVHRIDKGTSGLIIVAKNDRAHRNLARQFKQRKVKKVYIAIVKGVVQLDNGTIDGPIARSRYDRKKMRVQFVEAKPAITHYSVIRRYRDATLLEIRLETGRTHQIRVHMQHIGHPIIGDVTYGSAASAMKRPALHAKTIGFTHPATKRYMEFDSELPDDMRSFLTSL